MDFEPTSAQEIKEIIHTVRAFTSKELTPFAEELDREERFARYV